MSTAAGILDAALQALAVVIIVRSVMTFFPVNQTNAFVRALDRCSEPMLAPARRVVRPWMGMDFSGLLAIGLIMLMRVVVGRSLGD